MAEALSGRLVVQLSSGTPREARALQSWVAARGADYLDGAIAAWPRHIGGPEASITVVGSEPVFVSAQPLLKLLAGTVTYMGSDIGRAMAVFNAALAYLAGHWIRFSYGAAISEAEGIDTTGFGEMLAGLSPPFITDGRFGEPESSIKPVSAVIGRLVQLSADLNIGRAFLTFAADIFRGAQEAGFGAEDHAAVVQVGRGRTTDTARQRVSHLGTRPAKGREASFSIRWVQNGGGFRRSVPPSDEASPLTPMGSVRHNYVA